MAGAAKKWAVGCGIGCGLIIIIVGGIGTCGYLGVKKITDRADDLEVSSAALVEAYGEVGEFVPEADGTIPYDRLELFLTIREDLAETGGELVGIVETLDGERSGGVIAKVKAGFNLVPGIFSFIEARNGVLTERGMGLGEYTHTYTVAYYAWLAKDPADGPSFQVNGDDNDNEDSVRWGVHRDDEGDVRSRREERLRRDLHDIQRRMLDNQLAAAEGRAVDEAWLAELRAESARMDDIRRRLLWEDWVPAPVRDSLEPFRVRLEESYTPLMNAVEMGLVDTD